MPLQFRALQLTDRPLIEAYRAAWELESSEFTFTNLFMWGIEGNITAAFEQDVVYVLLTYSGEPPFMFAPLPRDAGVDYRAAVARAEDYFAALGSPPRFAAIAGPLRKLFQDHCPEYILREDRDNFDYVYRGEDLLTLRGRKYHAKRNHINQFRAQYASEYVRIDESMREECLQLYLTWLEHKDVFVPGVLGELEAIRALLTNMSALNVVAGGLKVDGRLAAYAVGERMRPDMALVHIEKADPAIPGLYAMINQQFVEHEWQDVPFINREEDMGLEGLRRSKLSYNPVRMIEKYEAVKQP